MKLNLKEYTDTLRTISLEILVLCAQVIFKLSFIYLLLDHLSRDSCPLCSGNI